MRKIGLLGGTFDPPHIGHFIIAQEVKDALGLDEVWFIPTNVPPHKAKAFFNASERYEMLKRATDVMKGYTVSPIELNRKGKSFTFDTIKELTNKFPDDKFHFIIGADMVQFLPKWQHIDELISLVEFIGVKRKDYSLRTRYPVTIIDVPIIDISSTDIKRRIKNRQEVKYFLPYEVYLYIKEYLSNESEGSR